LCIIGIVILFLRSFFTFFLATPDGFGMSSVAIDGQKIVMDKPRLSCFKRDGSSYEMTARDAIQDLRVPNILELNILHTRIQNSDKSWTNLWGDFGIYDSKAEKLNVRGNIRVRTDAGTEADLADAAVEFKGGVVVTDKPVEVRSNQGKVNAQKMQIQENGKHMVFEGNVQSVFVNANKGEENETPLRTGAQNEE